jgi:hypothetical protein
MFSKTHNPLLISTSNDMVKLSIAAALAALTLVTAASADLSTITAAPRATHVAGKRQANYTYETTSPLPLTECVALSLKHDLTDST